MKLFTKIFLCMAFIVSLTFAQDSLYVPAYPPGTLNTVIHGDTLSNGEQAHKVYVLQQTASFDTTYYITEELRVENLTLVGKNNPLTGFPPVVSVWINEDGNSPGNIAVAINNGFVHFKNLYLTGKRFDGSQTTGQCVSTSDSCKLIMENCIFEDFGSTGTPNVLNTWNAIGSDIYVTNCLFRLNQSNVPQNPGMNWAGPGVNAIDSMIVRNSTFFFFGGNIEGSGSSMGYLEFDHNTMFMHTKSSPFSMRQMHNAKITNNIFFSCYSTGLDDSTVNNPNRWNANFYSPPAILTLDSLYSDLEGDPYNLTEADRNIQATNNAYFWPSIITDNYATMNSAGGDYFTVGGTIHAPTWAAARVGAEAILDLPNIDITTGNVNVDPGFDADLVSAAADSMAFFVRFLWSHNNDGSGERPFIYSNKSNYNLFANVASDWKDKQNYPVRENLTYTNASLMTAGTDGKPLGDLNWFPDIINSIDGGKGLNTVPTKLTLKQNYPNPFNPTTTIEYSITKSAHVSLKVYNLLGKEVTTLVNKNQTAGEHAVEFDASNLASGVYLYKIKAGNTTITKKMVLIK